MMECIGLKISSAKAEFLEFGLGNGAESAESEPGLRFGVQSLNRVKKFNNHK